MKRRFVAVLLAAVLAVGSSMPVMAAETEEGIVENETGNAAGEETVMLETNEEAETVIEAMEGGIADNQEEDTAEEEHFEEPVELAENDEVTAAETFSEVDKDGLKWEVTGGVLTISGNGVIERNESLLTLAPGGNKYNRTISSINIGEGIVGIGESAFEGFFGMTSVNIPGSVEEIGYKAFFGCTELKNLTIPEGVKRIGGWAFNTCTKLTNVTISGSVTEIGDGAFRECIALTSIVIPDSMAKIADGMFGGCSALTSIVIPDSVTKIGDGAFSRCGALTNVNIPDSVTEIGESAFGWCESLTSIAIPDGVTEIKNWTFADCAKLTEVTIPNTVTKIGNEAFRGCGMSELSIPGSVTEIGHLAFYNCRSLTSVFIPRGVTKVNSWAFRNCESLVDTKISNGVTEIAYGAFAGCKNLPEVTIPKSVKSVGYAAFSGCKGLKTVIFKGDAPEISSEASENLLVTIVDGMYQDVNDKGVEPFCNVAANAFYPTGNQTYTDEIRTAYGSGLTWEEQKKPELPFTDVSQEDWYLDAAGYVFSRGIMTGMNETEFGPSVKLSRAQFATILYRMEGEPEAAYDAAAFPDVKEGQFYTAPAMWAKGSSVIKGYEDGRFGPADEITREDMALMMYRYANMLGLDTTARGDISGFPDAEKVSGYAADAMKWAVGEEIIKGKEEAGKDNIIEPQGTAERAQCATIIMRFMEGYGL